MTHEEELPDLFETPTHQLISILNTPDRIKRIDQLTCKLVRKNDDHVVVEFNERLVGHYTHIDQLIQLMLHAMDKFEEHYGDSAPMLARAKFPSAVSGKVRTWLMMCEVFFEDEYQKNPSYEADDKSHILVTSDSILGITFKPN